MAHATLPEKAQPQVKDWIAYHGLVSPNAKAMIDLASNREFNYREMDERVGRAAALLSQTGVGAQDRVGYLALNSTDIFEVVFATWRIGGISLALNFRLTASELKFIIDDAGAKVIVYDVAFSSVVEELKKLVDVVWISTDGLGGDSELERGLASHEPVRQRTIDQNLNSQAMLMYSSGTTGQPKGVIITHENLLYSALEFSTACNLGQGAVYFAVMPLFHIAGFNVLSCANIRMGGTVIIARAFDPKQALAVIGDPDFGVTHFLAVPAIYNALKDHPDFAKTDFSRLRHALAGATAIPHSLIRWWMDQGVCIQEGFGMTETAGGTCLLPKADVPHKIGSAGKAFMNSEMKIVTDSGETAAPNEVGEIYLRGPIITPGYWNRPEANKQSFVDGWFKSGDIGRMEADGFIYIEDRVKDMYISGGENVYPAEIENLLLQMPQIQDVAVIGLKDQKWGEVGCVVAVTSDPSLNIDQVKTFCADKLAKYKHPSHLLIVDQLPRNATGKVLKFELRELAAQKYA